MMNCNGSSNIINLYKNIDNVIKMITGYTMSLFECILNS